jgi:hypothetical protein
MKRGRKIFVILPDYPYEGFGEPIAAFLSKRAATAAHIKLGVSGHVICECELSPTSKSKKKSSGKLVEEWFITSEPKAYGKTRKSVHVRKEILVAEDSSS